MAKMVQIHSNVTIRVTTGLQNQDVTNESAHIPDRLKVNPEWPKHQVLIRQGAGTYPFEITEWPSVKALVKEKVLTIGTAIDVDDTTLTTEQAKALMDASEAKESFKLGVEDKTTKRKSITLDDLAKGGK